jgi:hypothetical protein
MQRHTKRNKVKKELGSIYKDTDYLSLLFEINEIPVGFEPTVFLVAAFDKNAKPPAFQACFYARVDSAVAPAKPHSGISKPNQLSSRGLPDALFSNQKSQFE